MVLAAGASLAAGGDSRIYGGIATSGLVVGLTVVGWLQCTAAGGDLLLQPACARFYAMACVGAWGGFPGVFRP